MTHIGMTANSTCYNIWVVVSNIFYFHPYLGKISNLTNIFQMGWNHLAGLLLAGFRLASKAHALTQLSMKIVEDQGRYEELCVISPASNGLELANFHVSFLARHDHMLGKLTQTECLRHEYVKFMYVIDPSLKKRRHIS